MRTQKTVRMLKDNRLSDEMHQNNEGRRGAAECWAGLQVGEERTKERRRVCSFVCFITTSAEIFVADDVRNGANVISQNCETLLPEWGAKNTEMG